MWVFYHSIKKGKEKYYVLYLGGRNFRGSYFHKLNLLRNIYIQWKESFAYDLPDFPQKIKNY